MGVVVRRYIDFLILLISTPLVSVLFYSKNKNKKKCIQLLFRSENKSMTEKYIVNNTFTMYNYYVAHKCGMTAYKRNKKKKCSTQLWSRWDFECPHHH